jgi:hypothetical protein
MIVPQGRPGQPVMRMIPVDAKAFEAVGYSDYTRQLYIKFRDSPTLCFEDVPHFRHSGLMAAPRKDAYYATYIKDRFLAKEVTPPA